MILNALDGRPLPIYGDGGNVRDWIHVEDHCRGVLEVLRHGRPGERYNLGGRSERTNLEIVDTICDALESERPAAGNPALAGRGIGSYRQLKTFVADRPGHDRRYAIDDAKIRGERGFFLETYQKHKYGGAGLPEEFVQDNHSYSVRATLRGLHAQLRRPQGKLIRAVDGEIFDVAVDIRPESPTFGHWVGEVLSGENFR